ncbi:murein L,D-transpeptidase catalytic domain family protein [Elizabethkingia meningoseptica]|uniref:murein L,D-transpeptidase catalytic domain family protein n=1 Tax=Elizabethkingia meningoseptica TaxID=238 RepID=UPI0023B16067|nr:murein L,D-transpeptidase catalytic domain family protein [Elizabethkingia meningoseptica]MDE5431753.1 murein L,D-transpeptidase catalytic domain family protein [Elizabethkingia meningoseptica]MEC4710293.1 murein L,D-transpeptidase catalytic domain family protein [Elizabethkingia meningoseptica]
MKKLVISLISVYVVSTSFFVNDTNFEESGTPVKKEVAVTKEKTESKHETTSSSAIVYEAIDFTGFNKLSEVVFEKAYLGYENLKKAGKVSESSNLLTICDFSLSSNMKRLWVIDVKEKKVVFNSLVAHGKGTGEEFAEKFSNRESSHQSSLGFYTTENTYQGDNGYSLKLEGLDAGYNDAAYKRAIVVHGADYVNEAFALQHKRIGRSWGCPALPRDIAASIIDAIKDKNVLFIYYPDQNYLASSQWLKSPVEDMNMEKARLANN